MFEELKKFAAHLSYYVKKNGQSLVNVKISVQEALVKMPGLVEMHRGASIPSKMQPLHQEMALAIKEEYIVHFNDKESSTIFYHLPITDADGGNKSILFEAAIDHETIWIFDIEWKFVISISWDKISQQLGEPKDHGMNLWQFRDVEIMYEDPDVSRFVTSMTKFVSTLPYKWC